VVLDDSFIHFASVDVDGYTRVKNDKSRLVFLDCVTIYEALTEMERTNDGGSPSLAPIFVLLGTGCLDLRWKRVFFFLVGERALGGV